MRKDACGLRPESNRGYLLLSALAVTLLSLLVPPLARGAAVTDVGEGFPATMGESDQIVLATPTVKRGVEEDRGRPWSIWTDGKSVAVHPINGEAITEGTQEEIEDSENHHLIFLDTINGKGETAGFSSVPAPFGETEDAVVPVVVSSSGVARQVGVLEEPLTEQYVGPHGEEETRE